jgi:hypothetical protein
LPDEGRSHSYAGLLFRGAEVRARARARARVKAKARSRVRVGLGLDERYHRGGRLHGVRVRVRVRVR